MIPKKILVAAGSSGGHIFPALSFIEALKTKYKDADIILLLPQKNILKETDNRGYRLKYISLPPVKLNFSFGTLKGLFKLIKAGFQVVFIIIDFKPDWVVGFGSLICLPAILSAWFFRVTTLIHEQNVSPGRANRFLAGFSDKIAISFKETENYFKAVKKKVVLTGNPIRKSLIKIDRLTALAYFGLEADKFTVLVIGGSQGSHRINEEFLKFASLEAAKSRLQVIHLSGNQDYAQLKQSYERLGIKFRLFDFFTPMEYAYSAADLILSRAGATTITEIMFFEIPAIIIPYPYAYKHQLSNARVLEGRGCALIIEDNNFCTDSLRETLLPLVDNSGKMEKMRLGFNGLFQQGAAEKLVGLAQDF